MGNINSNLVPRTSFLVKHVVDRGPRKCWLSHDQFSNIFIWKIYYRNYVPEKLQGKFSCYIGKFGHVTTSLCQGLLPHVPPQRPWGRGCISSFPVLFLSEITIHVFMIPGRHFTLDRVFNLE